MTENKITHWTYPYLDKDKRDNVLTACGIRVNASAISYTEPTCERCRLLMEEYERMEVK